MKKLIAIVLMLALVFTMCSCAQDAADNDDRVTSQESSAFTANIDKALAESGIEELMIEGGNTPEVLEAIRAEMMKLYGENREITDEYDETLAAKTVSGTYVGKKDENGIVSWKGVPFAKQPVGELRWKAPQAPDPSDNVYEAYYFGHSSLQVESFDEVSALYPQGEDCLNLNVWNNTADLSDNKPIMVWIHGGAYIQGGAVEPEYEGTNFVKNNPEVIYASIDYRTDIMGFINLTQVPGGEAYKESANLGLLDQVAALRWLKENAKAFGGDPERITIFGESAGAGSISALTIMPQANGLFKRAIMESGASSNFVRSAEKSIAHTDAIMEATGAKNMDDLLSLTESDLRKVETLMCGGASNFTYPQCDGVVLPIDMKEALSSGTRDGIDILLGTNKNEYNYFTWVYGKELNYEFMKDIINSYVQKMSDDERARFEQFETSLTGDEYDTMLEIVNYISFHCANRFEAKTHAERGQNAYVYFFTEESNNPDLLSYHAFELGYVFGDIWTDEVKDEEEAWALSRIMQKMWVNFALTGDPSIKKGDVEGVDEIRWEKYDVDEKKVMVINSEKTGMEIDPLKGNIDLIGDVFWAKLRK